MVDVLKPLNLTWRELHQVMQPLHLNIKAEVDSLHDVWRFGAPIPQSIIRNPKGYDERLPQVGNFESRIVFPTLLAKWIMDVSTRRGFPYSWEQAIALTQGHAVY